MPPAATGMADASWRIESPLSKPIPEEVAHLIHESIQSVMEVEILLLMHGRTQVDWSPDEIARALYLDGNSVSDMLTALVRRGLIGARRDGPRTRFVFEPASPEVARAIDTLATTYAERRVAITGLIYAKPQDPLRDFSDAFRLRKE